MNETEQFWLDAYKKLDLMKVAIQERYTEIHNCEPGPEDLASLCWYVWRLSNFYRHALSAVLSSEPEPHAPYRPPEVTDDRTARLKAMDAQLREVLGDSVDEGDSVPEEDVEDEDEFVFQPDAAEQILMVEYGSIIVAYEPVITAIQGLLLGDGGDDRRIQNIVMKDMWGFNTLLDSLRQAVLETA